jgi:adenosylmethionine-8-amino-7-oxononanoate aminotransferase
VEEKFLKLLQRDRSLIWHPYSQHGLNQELLPVVSAQGAYLKLADQREILDGISSWWVNIHGHGHPEIAKAIYDQAKTLDHVIFAGFTHHPAVELAECLTQYSSIRNAGLTKVFYSDNGSTAVEVALKMAYQYHQNRGDRKRTRFLALRNSYHGDTLGAMAVCEPEGFHQIFQKLLPQVDFIDPYSPNGFQDLEALLEKNSREYAAFIFEPLIQGAGGMRIYEREFLRQAVERCQHSGVLTIADEVFTGFFRTGTCFAFEQAQIRPDLVCLSKGLTGGVLPLAVTLANEEIYSAFLGNEIRTAFLHGHSYTANPVSCAAGLASWKLLHQLETSSQIEMISSVTRAEIQQLTQIPSVQAARSIGTIGAVELKNSTNYFSSQTKSVLKYSVERGVLLRPLGNVIYAVPPYCCTSEEIKRIYRTIAQLAEELA